MPYQHAPLTPGRVVLDAARLFAKLLIPALVFGLVSSLSGGRKSSGRK